MASGSATDRALSTTVERLARLMEHSDIDVWLHKPVPAPDDEKPIDLIARGEHMRVASLVSALEEAPFT
jgi:NAD(P)H-dependent FMN reductase